jgi:hypothetical protein
MNYEELCHCGWTSICKDRIDPDEVVETFIKIAGTKFIVEKKILYPHTSTETKKTNTLSAKYGLKGFPLHTDGAHYLIPPRYVLLNYTAEKVSASPTLIFDTKSIPDTSVSNRILEHEIHYIRGEHFNFYSPLINKTFLTGHSIFRYNPLVMKRLLDREMGFQNLIKDLSHEQFYWRSPSLLILDNWRVLHGRGPVENKELSYRLIHRYNLSIPKIL